MPLLNAPMQGTCTPRIQTRCTGHQQEKRDEQERMPREV